MSYTEEKIIEKKLVSFFKVIETKKEINIYFKINQKIYWKFSICINCVQLKYFLEEILKNIN